MKICFVRHGETDWNVEKRFQGRENTQLNSRGHAQAKETANALKNSGVNWQAIISSPLKRAESTAVHIACALNLPIEKLMVDAALVERDFGSASGLKYEEYERRFKDAAPQGMEGIELVKERMYKSLLKLIETYPGFNLVVVSHGGSINALLHKLSNGRVGTGITGLKNACINLVTYDKETGFNIPFCNKEAGEVTAADFCSKVTAP